MSNWFNIRRKILYSILAATLIPFIAGIGYISVTAQAWLYENYLEHSEEIITQTTARVEKAVYEDLLALSSMLAQDERIIQVDGTVNSYVDYDPNVFKPTDTTSERQIMALFKSAVDTQGIVTFISYGTYFGGYIEYPNFKPNGPYDPRTRGWYINAIKHGGVTISEPYLTKISNELVVSADSVVHRGDEIIGVVSVTVRLESIMEEVGRVKLGETGHIYIISPDGSFINCPSSPEFLMEPYDEIGIGSFDELKKNDGKSFEGIVKGVPYLFTVRVSPMSGWTYIAAIEKREVMKNIHDLSILMAFTLLAIIVFIHLFVIIITTNISKRIIFLATVIKQMSKFDFAKYKKNNLDNNGSSKDEIGEIARALSSMQDNYLELSAELSVMDKAIKSINIENPSVAQIGLSSENPLNVIAQSVNGLLEKVLDYIGRIREFNTEITIKNEKLNTSEEELTAKLEEINQQKEKIHYLAHHDSLTDLPNRRNFMHHLLATVQRGVHGAVILLDIDNFKSINDTMGHVFGDKVLQMTAKQLESLAEHCVFVSRFGGDEFLILFECDVKISDIQEFAKKIFRNFETPLVIDGNEIRVELSIGIARFPQDSKDIEQIIMNADLAMYAVKNSVKNNYAFFDIAMADRLKEKLKIKDILHKALENDGLKIVYQPKVSLADGAVIGYEALVRLREHALSPSVFIRVAEESGLIIPLGRAVTGMVIGHMAGLRNMGIKLKPISINYSALQLTDAGYATYLIDCLKEHAIDPSLIEIEVTEHVLMGNKEHAIEFMKVLRSQGMTIAVDDFGAEYSSLNYISSLPIDTLKLDREMNLMFLERAKPAAMEVLLEFIHSLDLVIVAEGIESMEHVKRLKTAGCDIIQGYCFSRPIEVDEIMEVDGTIYPLT